MLLDKKPCFSASALVWADAVFLQKIIQKIANKI